MSKICEERVTLTGVKRKFSLLHDTPFLIHPRRRIMNAAQIKPYSIANVDNMTPRLKFGKHEKAKKGKKVGNFPQILYWPPCSPGPYLSQTPAKLPRSESTRKVYSDFFLASTNPYKARIAKFVRYAQTGNNLNHQTDDENDSKNIELSGMPYRLKIRKEKKTEKHLLARASKRRFSFKRDGIVSISHIVDIFCAGLFHEASNCASRREMKEASTNNKYDDNRGNDRIKVIKVSDIQYALDQLDWRCIRLPDYLSKNKKRKDYI